MKWIAIGAVNGLLAVAAGAFGAHGLKDHLSPSDLNTFEIAARYHMYHSLAMLAVGWVSSRRGGRAVTGAGVCMLIGVVLFSGSLYGLSMLAWRGLALVTPIGGLFFMIGWLLLAIAAGRGQGRMQEHES